MRYEEVNSSPVDSHFSAAVLAAMVVKLTFLKKIFGYDRRASITDGKLISFLSYPTGDANNAYTSRSEFCRATDSKLHACLKIAEN